MGNRFRRHLVASIGGLLMTLLVVLFAINAMQPRLLGLADAARQLEALAYDLRLRTLLDRQPPRRQPVVIVDIDEASLAELGQWPWPRAQVAGLMQRLDAHGVAVIAFDAVFSEAEANPVDRVLGAAGAALPPALVERLLEIAPRLDGDRILAETIAGLGAAEVVLGYFLGHLDQGVGARPVAALRLDADAAARSSFLSFSSWTGPSALQHEQARAGHVVTVPDDLDGVIRRAPLLVRLDDALLPSLALEAVRTYLLLDEIDVTLAPQGRRLITTSLQLGSALRIPLDERGRVLVPYRGPAYTFPYISAGAVLGDRLGTAQQAMLRDALVLVGTSSIGLADLRSTPTDRVYPGVEVHATVADALLETAQRQLEPGARPAFPSHSDLTDATTVLGLLVAGVLLSLLVPLLGPLALGVAAVALVGGWLTLGAWAWLRGIDVPVTAPLLLVLLISGFNLLRGFVRESSSRRELRSMFDQYVPPTHIERMVALGQSPTLDGESRVMTVLFADIQGFTRLSEGLTAPELKRVLNEFFTPLTRVILEHQGTIDKYVGDMIMAFWNAPLVDARHREHALDAALEMIARVEDLKRRFASRGLPEIEIGIGLNSGLMNVGDMGSDFRRAYTVIGDAVNLASRIEGLTRQYGALLLVGEQTRDESPDFLFRFVDLVRVKGRGASVRIYEPIGREDRVPEALQNEVLRWHGAYWKFMQQDWDGAAADLEALIEQAPTTALYRIYRARIEALRDAELPVEWNGETVMTEK